MKCPKCAYVGFDATDRCRHCGFDFSLMAATVTGTAAPSVGIDLPLPVAPSTVTPIDLPLRTVESRVPTLFNDPAPPPAGPPLAVRRTAERPRTRPLPRLVRSRPMLAELDAAEPEPEPDTPEPATARPASFVARLAAALLDLAVLAAIDAAAVYLTTQIAGLSLSDVLTLPLVPLGLFLGGVDLAYLLVFTVQGGQTLGKMALGLRVEAVEGRLTLGRGLMRVAMSVAGGAVLGLGFAVAALRQDGRSIHDQLAGTRVVKVDA